MIQGISQRKFLEILIDLFEKHNWCSTISPMDFEMASIKFKFSNYHIEADIKRVNNMECKACGTDPLACHCDANMKCYRLESANEDEEFNEFIADVNSEIPIVMELVDRQLLKLAKLTLRTTEDLMRQESFHSAADME
ncbi:hypothetical protein OUZ56_018391 [Daphnia magna]|uniref:CxC3 like cysteine cluster domain-containing protein n=1 Tax=Daphnia magna TaxID=35525 RepID=A0ABQ9Z8Q2_9CRUS|nr:hypothetical protein OUZ56_018391 [Daphnia magna]